MKKKSGLILSALFFLMLIYFYESKNDQKINIEKNAAQKSEKITVSPKSSIYKKISHIRQNLSKPRNEIISKSQLSFEKAMSRFGTNEYEKLLRETISIDPDNVLALGHFSEYLLGQNKIDESRILATECIARDSKNEVCHRSLISSFTRYGEFDEAYQYFKDCLNEVPENIHCNSGLFTYYLSKNEVKDAETILEQMIKASPDSLWTIISKGTLAHYKGNFKDAYLFFSQACDQKNPYACKMKNSLSL